MLLIYSDAVVLAQTSEYFNSVFFCFVLFFSNQKNLYEEYLRQSVSEHDMGL